MIAWTLRCSKKRCGKEFESSDSNQRCECGAKAQWFKARQGENVQPIQRNWRIAPNHNARQQAYIDLPETQAKLRSGELSYMKPSDDAAHV